ncbi:major facilitator superfamily domain-containing protein, partial [Lentinula lateritia]
LALGLYAAGSSMGGTVLPITARALIPLIGFPWTMWVFAAIILFGLAMGNLVNLHSPLHLIFLLYCSASFSIYLGYYTFTTYIATSAISNGVPVNFSFYLVAICNACSGLSRLTSGFIADRLGAINLMVPATCLSAAIYYIWPFSHSQVGFVFLSVFYGISIGPLASLVSSPVLDLGDRNQLGQRIGILMSMVSVAMLAGAPISGAINTSQGPVSMGLFAGTVAQVLFHFQSIL